MVTKQAFHFGGGAMRNECRMLPVIIALAEVNATDPSTDQNLAPRFANGDSRRHRRCRGRDQLWASDSTRLINRSSSLSGTCFTWYSLNRRST